jgi:formylglycine-generating enzyme required for sulfatase activity
MDGVDPKRRLAALRFATRVFGGVVVMIPPLCTVLAGDLLMGSDPTQDPELAHDEQPQHTVTLDTFQLGRFPVTVAEYACFVRVGHAEPRPWEASRTWRGQLRTLDHPVVNVSWHDAVAYAAWLSQVTATPWRLPTEAEWEKAARCDPVAGHARLYPWGDAFDRARCNAYESRRHGRSTPVGRYPHGASPCGARDMAGNVWEWTSSVYMLYPYRADDGHELGESTESRAPRCRSGTM